MTYVWLYIDGMFYFPHHNIWWPGNAWKPGNQPKWRCHFYNEYLTIRLCTHRGLNFNGKCAVCTYISWVRSLCCFLTWVCYLWCSNLYFKLLYLNMSLSWSVDYQFCMVIVLPYALVMAFCLWLISCQNFQIFYFWTINSCYIVPEMIIIGFYVPCS